MFGFRTKKFVVMDGSNFMVLNNIISIARMIAGETSVKALRRLDNDHPTMMVIEMKTNKKNFDALKTNLSETYPALCVFDAVL